MKVALGYFLLLLIYCFYGATTSRVLELSDKFVNIKEGAWFVKFYAPWCSYCRRLEPIWAHVAQALCNTPIRVAKADCTRFPNLLSHYTIKAYPTIIFIKGPSMYEYTGELTKDDMVSYAIRMAHPSVHKISQVDNFKTIRETNKLFFGYVGEQSGPLWEMFAFHAETYRPNIWFYSLTHDVITSDFKPANESYVFVSKDDEVSYFEATPSMIEDKDILNVSLDKWINMERFGNFPKITRTNIRELKSTGKYLVIVVLSENKLNEISQTEQDFKDMVEGLHRKRKAELHHRFQFGWTGTPELANSIAMSHLTVPHLLVVNTTTEHHHLPDDDPVLMTPEAISMFLDQVHNQMAPVYGGNGWLVRVSRLFFEVRTTLLNMWRGNPILTTVVFGLPLGFLSLICYSVCCGDILEADEEEPTETHEKKD